MVTRSFLDNGIRIISENIPHALSVSVGIWVATGSRHENVETNGVAHFIEHLLFKGTARRSALEIAREIDSVGGVLNAFTCREYICFYVKVLSDYLAQGVDLLSDIFLHSEFDPTEVEKEREVILQEIWMLKDSPDSYIHDLVCQNLWKGHPLGMSIIGSEESVGSLRRDVIVDNKNCRFCAEDIIIAVAGKVEHTSLLNLLNGLFSGMPGGSFNGGCRTPSYEKRVESMDKDLEQVHICLGTRAFPQNHPWRYNCHVLNTILAGSMSSRLFQEIRENRGLAYSIYSYLTSHSDAGSMVIYAGTSQERVLEVIEIILAEIRRLRNEPVPESEINLSKQHLKGNLLLSLENCDSRMTRLAKDEIYFGRSIPIREITRGIDNVTSEDLMKLSRELFDDSYFTLQTIGNLGEMHIEPAAVSL